MGDTLASVLEASGAEVWREFYVNDAGNQIEKFAILRSSPKAAKAAWRSSLDAF